MGKSKLLTAVIFLLVFGVSTGISYTIFSQQTKKIAPPVSTKSKNGTQVTFDTSLPKTEPCPLNGALYSTQQKQWWEKHRPLGVMIENHEEARPQSGLSSADVVYEAVAEGAITRFLAVFYCQDAGYVGPVRSARTYFLDFISEYGDYPLYAHVGGANTEGPADALGQIIDYGWSQYNDLSEFSIGCPIFCRIENRVGKTLATEHTMYAKTKLLWDYAGAKRQLSNVDKKGNLWNEKFVSYSFKDDVKLTERPGSQAIHLEFWKDYKQYGIDWTYDKQNNMYKRNNGGAPHVDFNTKKQLTAKNIVVLSMIERNANDGYENNLHLLYGTKGTGKATIFMDGVKITGTWRKSNRTSRTLLFDSTGSAIKFNKGLIWFEILPINGILSVT